MSAIGTKQTSPSMQRREFITLLGGAAAAWPLAARAQQSDRMRRIGVLQILAAGDPEWQIRFAAFKQGLQELGWLDGRNFTFEFRNADGRVDRLPTLAAELVHANVDKIFKGARPADLPVEQPTKFELVINLKAAKALGLRISPALLTRAEEVIE